VPVTGRNSPAPDHWPARPPRSRTGSARLVEIPADPKQKEPSPLGEEGSL
jgi:hypothetical protein